MISIKEGGLTFSHKDSEHFQEAITFCSGNIFRWFFLQKISTLSENHESGLHHEYLGRKKVWSSDIFKIWNFDFTYETFLVYTYFSPAEIFMMKPGFVVFRQRRYFLQKISSENIAGAKSYGDWHKNIFCHVSANVRPPSLSQQLNQRIWVVPTQYRAVFVFWSKCSKKLCTPRSLSLTA